MWSFFRHNNNRHLPYNKGIKIMKVTQETRNALKLINKLLTETQNKRAVDLAIELNIPKEFTMRILNTLARNKIITSIKGPRGGFKANELTLTTTIGQVQNALYRSNKEERKASDFHSALVDNFIQNKVNEFNNTLISDMGRL
jgi:DNA-binding IscR family transcriptional regulator